MGRMAASPLFLISDWSSQWPGAVKGAQRRSEPLTARTAVEYSSAGKGGAPSQNGITVRLHLARSAADL
jgi:hypothetical protein